MAEPRKPWQQVRTLVLYCPAAGWRYSIYGDGGTLDGTLRDLPAAADLAQAQAALLRRVAELTGRYHQATWRQDRPPWWSAELLVTQPPTRAELAGYLEVIGVRPDAYSLFGAQLDGAMVMDRRPAGWVVFHCERGGEFAIEAHQREAAACGDLLARLLGNDAVFYQLVVGPSAAGAADREFDRWLHERNLARDDLSPTDWSFDDVPWAEGSYRRRYFVRIASSFGRIV